METEKQKSVQIFRGPAIDVKMVKQHLENNGIKSFIENNTTESAKFDPNINLYTNKSEAKQAISLIQIFMNKRAQ